jgi:ABC-type phosphate transport system auxiliary subunit
MATYRKKDLKDFINKRIATKVGEVNRMKLQMFNELAKPYITKHVSLSIAELGQRASKIADELEKVKEEFGIDSYRINNTISNINYGGSKVFDIVAGKITSTITDLGNGNLSRKEFDELKIATEELYEIGMTAREYVKQHDKIVKELNELNTELIQVIDSEKSGKKAFDKLMELNVDMSGYEPEDVKLPTVSKLRSNVDLFNKK